MESAIVSKLLDYGVLGLAVFVLGLVVYKMSQFILGEIGKTKAACEDDRQKLIAKLEQKDAIIIEHSSKCIASIDENTKVTKELCAEIRTRRVENTPPKGHHT